MIWYSGVGEDNVLMDFIDSQTGKLTALYELVAEKAIEFGAQLIVIDTAADTFGGNENARGEVRRFINCLTQLALKIDGAVLLCAHPSASGIASGRGDGGNTAWNNSVRSRLYLHRPSEEGGEDNTDLRILTRKKANYARTGDDLPLVWQDGVFALQGSTGGIVDAVTRQSTERRSEECFLKAMDDFEAQGRNLSSSKNAGNYAAKLMASNPRCKGLKRGDLCAAMERLFHTGAIRDEVCGRGANPAKKIVKAKRNVEAEHAC